MKNESSDALRRTLIAMTMAALGAAAGCKGDPAPAATATPATQASTGGESPHDAPAGAPAAAATTTAPVSNETACGHGACS